MRVVGGRYVYVHLTGYASSVHRTKAVPGLSVSNCSQSVAPGHIGAGVTVSFLGTHKCVDGFTSVPNRGRPTSR